MDITFQLLLAILAPIGFGLVSLLLPRQAVGQRVGLAVCGPLAAITLLANVIAERGLGGGPTFTAWMPELQLNLAFHPDHLGMFFALLVACIGVFITLYARAYFGPDRDALYRFYPYLLLFMTAMLGVALADGFMLLLLFWELTSISSFLLIGWDRDDAAAVRKAMQAFITTALGGLAMMAGLILLGVHTQTWTFSGLLSLKANGVLTADAPTVASFLLIFIGAAAKSAQIPFHFWLPGAMAAPTPVSAYLHSATMVKAGVYLAGRMWPIFAVVLPIWPSIIVPLGAATMVYGAFIAIQKQDLKQIFAYSTVSQLGLLMAMYGLGAFAYHGHPNLLWDVTQILNHALYKAPLFILAGAIGHVASRQLPELKGLFYRGRTERIMTIVILLAGYALAAGPLTMSFTAKELFFYQIYHAKEAMGWGWNVLVAAGVATGMFNVAIFIRLATTMLGRGEHAHHAEHDHAHGHGDHGHETGIWPAFLWIPGALIVSFQFVGGLIPGAYERLFGWLDPNRFNYEGLSHFPMTWDAHWGLPLQMSLAAIGLGLILGFLPILRRVYNDPFDQAYPGFYTLTTKGGGWLFGRLQTGHAGLYVALVFASLVGLFVWTLSFQSEALRWPAGAMLELDQPQELRAGAMLTVAVCLSAILVATVRNRIIRVLVLGVCGFSVTAVYYFYKAPDLALTQISIEIVSLILFLLVLSLLPREAPGTQLWVAPRLIIGLAVGGVMFWLTLTSSVAARPTMPYVNSEGKPYAHLGEYFLRNSYHGEDTLHAEAYGGVVDRGEAHATSFGSSFHGDQSAKPQAASVVLHKGGGGNNVVNVILVDFRGFDTMGEITVLGLAAMGVWTLLRRRRSAEGDGDDHGEGRSALTRLDIPEPTGDPDPEDTTMGKLLQRSVPL